MIIIQTRNYNEMSKYAADIIINEILKKPKIVIGFATGETLLGLYKELIKSHKKNKVDFSNLISFNLDEYYPMKRNDKNSYYYYMQKNLFRHINVKKSNIYYLNGEEKDWRKECKNYENKIKKNPIDVQILGLGANGHIAFNEPGSLNKSITRLVRLNEGTRRTNKINNLYALSMGVSTIMKSKKIVLLASGEEKAEAIFHLINGKVNKNWPVTYLRKHKNLIIILDKHAAGLLKSIFLEQKYLNTLI